MCLTVKRLYCISLPFLVFFLVLTFYKPTWAQSVESNSKKVETTTSAKNKSDTKSPLDIPAKEIPQQPTKFDLAGEKAGQQIDNFTQQASSRIGEWINAKVFAGITWIKLILSLLLLFVVLLIERIVRLMIDRNRKKAKEEDVNKIKHLILEAVAKPLSLFIWVYGVYIVLTPLFVHFQKPDGTKVWFIPLHKKLLI